MRQSVDQDTLYAILPDQIQLSFTSSFPWVSFLLAQDVNVQIYHNSFREFILSKTTVDTKKANDLVAGYINKFPHSELSVNHIVFHLSNSSNPGSAVIACSQQWADTCATNDVAPDLVINDIKLCITLSLADKNFSDIIRLLLLLQRVSFRYDYVFNENAHYLAQTLISLGRYEAALKYIVRDDTLMVSNHYAILFLQLFYEAEANAEASILLEAIDRKYRKGIREGFDSEEGLDIRIFTLKLQSLSLYMNEDYEYALNQWMYFQGKYRKMHEMSSEGSQINILRENAASWQSAYVLRQFDAYRTYKEIEDASEIKTTEIVATLLAKAAVMFDELNQYNSNYTSKGDKFNLLISDIEDIVTTIGYQKSNVDLFVLAKALVLNSKNSSITEKIVAEYLGIKFDFQLRMENGVDLNYQAVHTQLFRSLGEGYIDNKNNYPVIIKDPRRYQNWEAYVVSILKLLGFIEGKFFRSNASNYNGEKKAIVEKLDSLIKAFDLTLDERSYWDRSYHLPENVFPMLVIKLFDIVNEHVPERLPVITKLLLSPRPIQFGIYSEGFRVCLFDAISSCLRHGVKKELYMELIQQWYEHVLLIENRWERTEELLKVTEVYGLIDEREKAMHVFQEMLNTSMGPTWYKEAQLALIDDCMDLNPDAATAGKYLDTFAGILDFASGEMTFQRYVRNEKEVFVSALTDVKDLESAIGYFKFEVIPPPDVLITNAESRIIDAPRLGDGYLPGAANISEPSAIGGLIDKGESPYVRWFMTQVYVINDDVYRYLRDFAKRQAKCLNELQHDKAFLKLAKIQIQAIIDSKEVQEESQNVYEYASYLYENLGDKMKTWLRTEIKVGFDWREVNTSEEARSEQKPNLFDEFNLRFAEGKLSKKELILQAISAFEKEKINIWYGNWSKPSDTAKDNMRSMFSSPGEAITYLEPFIEEYSDEYWVMASQLLWFVRDIIPTAEKETILNIVVEHFQFIVRPDALAIKKYAWLRNEKQSTPLDSDSHLIDFLIWLLNHPLQTTSLNAKNALIQLSTYEPEKVIARLAEEIAKNQPRTSTTQCSFILFEITQQHPQQVIAFYTTERIEQFIKVNHFSIKKTVLDIGIELNKHGFNALYQAIDHSIPSAVVLEKEVFLEEDHLDFIQEYIDYLNGEKLLNRLFCDNLLTIVKEYCHPLSETEFEKSDRYLLRSFHLSHGPERYKALLRHALNVALTPRIQRSRYHAIFEVLNE